MRGKIMSIAIGIMAVLIALGSGFAVYMWVEMADRDVIDVNIGEGETKAITFESLSIAPGDTVDYTVKLKSEVEGTCMLELDFNDRSADSSEVNNLKDFVTVRIVIDEHTYVDAPLAEVMAGEPLELECSLSASDALEIEVYYHMPESVGNEAQRADALFELLLSVSNE